MLNKIMLIGHVGQKPEVKTLQSGSVMATFSIATSESWRDKASGERKQRTQWHRVVCFNEPLCKVIEQYVDKGSKLYVEGQLLSRTWKDKNEIEREIFELVMKPFNSRLEMLDRAERAPAASSPEDYGKAPDATPGAADAAGGSGAGKAASMDDEIPF